MRSKAESSLSGAGPVQARLADRKAVPARCWNFPAAFNELWHRRGRSWDRDLYQRECGQSSKPDWHWRHAGNFIGGLPSAEAGVHPECIAAHDLVDVSGRQERKRRRTGLFDFRQGAGKGGEV